MRGIIMKKTMNKLIVITLVCILMSANFLTIGINVSRAAEEPENAEQTRS